MEFKELGLTENEAKVYEILLKSSSSTAAHLSKESTVPYGRIYTVLESLEEKGLIRVIANPIKKYSLVDPFKLQQIIDDRIKNLIKINEEIKNYKKLYDSNIKEKIVVSKGKNNSTKLIHELKTPEKINYNIKHEINQEFVKNIKKTNKNVDVKLLSNPSKEYKIDGKILENNGVDISIIDEEVFIRLVDSNNSILVRDDAFAKIMKELFIKYYLQAEPLVKDFEKKNSKE